MSIDNAQKPLSSVIRSRFSPVKIIKNECAARRLRKQDLPKSCFAFAGVSSLTSKKFTGKSAMLLKSLGNS